MITVALVALAGAAVLAAARVIRRGELLDRVIGLDVLLIVVVGALAANGARSGDPLSLDLAIVVGFLGFLSTVAAALALDRPRDVQG